MDQIAMVPATLGDTLRRGLKAFRSARGANVTITFALALIPVVGLVGAAVDYSRANSARTAMQAALDSATLMLSKEASTLTSTQMTQKANDYFYAMFTRPEALNTQLSLSYDAAGSSLTLTAAANVNTSLMVVLGKTSMAIGSSSTVKWGTSRLRVALALDNTGSMASAGKITALKTATKNLLTQLKSAASQNGDVYVSIIPFSKDVNVGAANYSANWIDWTDRDESNGSCSNKNYTTQSSCTSKGKTWTADNHNTWNGCVSDRGTSTAPGTTAGYDQKVDPAAAGNTATLFPAEEYGYCPLRLMGLGYDWTAMNNLADQMYPNGSTNQPIGLVWSWLSLVGGGPLTAPAKDANYQYKQTIILLSDGLNTQDRWYGNGSTTSTQVDDRMYAANNNGIGTCKNIKDAGITIYTVQVNTDGDPTSLLLKNCASDAGKFFVLTSASQIVTTFNQIGTALTKLRIAK
jgi:Flp pilus assembly protein TadG